MSQCKYFYSPVNYGYHSKTYNALARVLQIKIMPTELQDCVQSWWDVTDTALRDNGDLTSYERNQIKPRVGTSKLLFPCLIDFLLSNYNPYLPVGPLSWFSKRT